MASNSLITHYFIKGMSADNSPNAESKETFEYALNGRLFSENGTISYTSIDGTIEVFKNPDIIKILGYSSFVDELVIMAKVDKELSKTSGEIIGYKDVFKLNAKPINLTSSNTSNSFIVNIPDYLEEISYKIPIYKDYENDVTINNPISCVDSMGEEINYSDYYKEIFNHDNIEYCAISETNQSYEHNKDYMDAFISIKKDNEGNFMHEILWVGMLNWDINSKIITHSVVENNNYKRVYFTDDVNPFRVINLKDKSLSFRTNEEFNSFQKSILLEPIIEGLSDKGMLTSGINLYAYRLTTSNGQVTLFSSFSKEVFIYPESNIFEGGKVGQATSKSVDIKLNLTDHHKFDEVQLIALEYHSNGLPRYIRNIGTKKVASVVRFTHYGNEPSFDSDLTLNDVLERSSNWSYCSDIKSKYNKMAASGLRNNPIDTVMQDMKFDFTLHGWDSEGKSHECLYNPNPKKYRFFNANSRDRNWYSILKRVYYSIQVFGDFTAYFKGPGVDVSKSFKSKGNNYQEVLFDIYNWIKNYSSRTNLKIELLDSKMVWNVIDKTKNRIDDYELSFNTQQVIPNYEDEFVYNNLNDSGQMVYGAQSLGYTKGNGIRISFRIENEEVMSKSNRPFTESKPLINMRNPSLNRGFMKGEIYRIGLLPYDTKGEELFVIPLGDIYIPALGDPIKELNDSGSINFPNNVYENSFFFDNKIYAQRIKMSVDVRMSCEIKKHISMYKLVYVKREGLNQTILTQGVSAPLGRFMQWDRTENVNINGNVADAWALPHQGGPLYDHYGLSLWDRKPNGPFSQKDGKERVLTNRKLFYFDSPDFIYDVENSELVGNCKVKRVGRLNTEPNPYVKNLFNIVTGKKEDTEIYPSFSRRIFYDQLEGDEYRKPEFVDIHAFLERRGDDAELSIAHAETLQSGEVIPGYNFGEPYEISNNAMTTQLPSWYWNGFGRHSDRCSNGRGKSTLMLSNNYSPGRKTVIIKTNENAFSDSFINQTPIRPVFLDYDRTGPGEMFPGHDTHGLFNLILNNEENVYGGRSERAYANNIYVSLSATIPVNKESSATQSFIVYGDVYTTLFLRNKNHYNSEEVSRGYAIRNGGSCGQIQDNMGVARNGAWCYFVVLETKVEPRLDHTNTFYKQNDKLDFNSPALESINEAYFQNRTIKNYIPLPYNFKDDPDMGNIIAISETKLYGEYLDSYLKFRTNNFYELEKEKGKVYNMALDLNNMYAVQEYQTSRIFIDENTMMDTSNGPISIQQGSGQGISNHQVISDYGTSIRRSVVTPISATGVVEGFTFFDERKKEFIHINKPKLFEKNLSLDFIKRYPQNIIDVEGWYDNHYKETNLRLLFEDKTGITISYNEKLDCFNGYMNYNEDVYINWNNDLYIPEYKLENLFLHQLNKGKPMEIRGVKHNMKMKVTSSIDGLTTLVFPDSKIITNINYPIKSVNLKTDFSGSKMILGNHHRYKIHEATHSFPLKTRNERTDTRGIWLEYELEVESKDSKKVSIFSITNFVRNSYQ